MSPGRTSSQPSPADSIFGSFTDSMTLSTQFSGDSDSLSDLPEILSEETFPDYSDCGNSLFSQDEETTVDKYRIPVTKCFCIVVLSTDRSCLGHSSLRLQQHTVLEETCVFIFKSNRLSMRSPATKMGRGRVPKTLVPPILDRGPSLP